MTVTISLDSRVLEALALKAGTRGVTLDRYLEELSEADNSPAPVTSSDATQEFDQALDELFAGDNRSLPSIPFTYSRADIYIEHD